MADADAEALIHKAIMDDLFRLNLSKDFDGTVATHNIDLSPEEMGALKAIDWGKRLPTKSGRDVEGTWVHIYKSSSMGSGGLVRGGPFGGGVGGNGNE